MRLWRNVIKGEHLPPGVRKRTWGVLLLAALLCPTLAWATGQLRNVDIAETINVSNGGTGATSFTANGVLYGNGTAALGATAAGAAGTVLAGGSPPAFSASPSLTDLTLSGTLTVGSGGAAVAKILSASAALDFPSTASGAASDLAITVTGAAVGDVVALGIPNGPMPAGAVAFTAWVSAADTVTVRFANFSGGALDLPSGTFRATVVHF